jgi:hypothetical protein
MLQGRGGIGAAPCCGTGVVFRRDVLVSVGGQAYGSITEVRAQACCFVKAGITVALVWCSGGTCWCQWAARHVDPSQR